jgi:SAM-dependent methyltransferase
MKIHHLTLLCDPDTREELTLEGAVFAGDEIVSGSLRSAHRTYPIIRGIPRFVDDEGYSDNFGYQWNRWARVQFEDHNVGVPMQGHTTRMFTEITRFSAERLRGKTVLDMGCGPGRFTDVALGMGASVVALDYSSAIDTAQANFAGKNADVLFVQGDALRLPLKDNSVDYSFSVGVLHHTPSPATGVREAYRVTRGGGVRHPRLQRHRLLHLSRRSLLACGVPGAQAVVQALPALGVLLPLRQLGLRSRKGVAPAELPAARGVPHRLATRLPLDHLGYLRCHCHHPPKRAYPDRDRGLVTRRWLYYGAAGGGE